MALTLSLKIPTSPLPSSTSSKLAQQTTLSTLYKPPPISNNSSPTLTVSKTRSRFFIPRAIEERREESAGSETVKEAEAESESESESPATQPDDLRAEIKKAMMERKEREGETTPSLWSGVADEVGEIEWPVFGKVLGLTGVVIGVIAGSSVVLLTVNFVLAELSDRVFAGRGVQDFFS